MALTRTPTQPNPMKQMPKQELINDAGGPHGADLAATARFVGPHLVVAGPSSAG